VVVTTSYPASEDDPSGHFVRAEVREYERAGHDVVVVRPPAGGAFGWPGLAARVRERPARAVSAGAWVARAREEVARTRATRVVAHWAVPSGWPIATAHPDARVEVVSHGGDVRLLLAAPSLVRERVVAAITARAAVWRFVSEALKRELLAGLRRTRAQVERIAEVRAASIELPEVRERAETKKRELGGLAFAVVVGRLVPDKRVDRVIAHVAEARAGGMLVVVGDGPERGRLEALARAKKVETRFVGLVPREEALAWIGAAEVVLHASEREGLSTVRREAEAMGVRWERVE
jgi:teichuronic acid biosynthesis glycosyltransferase TuaC